MRIRRKYVNDIIVYLQKTYKLYFVEFRCAPNGSKYIVMCHPCNKNWWIEISTTNLFWISIIVACAGKDDNMKETIKEDIKSKKYKGYAKKYVGKWLPL